MNKLKTENEKPRSLSVFYSEKGEKMRDIFLSELVGTFLLILLGNGVANVSLNKSGMQGAGPIQITIA